MTTYRHHRDEPHHADQAAESAPAQRPKWPVFAAAGLLLSTLSAAAVVRGASDDPPAQLQQPDDLQQQTQSQPPAESRPPVAELEQAGAAAPGQAGAEEAERDAASQRHAAAALAERIIEYLTLGPPLEAKLRQRVWAAGREVVEVGRYQQAGRGTGRLRMELQVPIADGKSRWQQTCDGRLAWTREEMAGEVRVRRVDIGKLDEATAAISDGRVPPRLRVGGLAEIIDRIKADFDLRLSEGHIDGAAMVVLKGTFREPAATALLESAASEKWPELIPRQVRIAVPADSLAAPLPARVEFWSEPGGRLISLLEIYDVVEIESPGIDQFRFEPGGHDFSNETELYIARFGVGLAEAPVGNAKR